MTDSMNRGGRSSLPEHASVAFLQTYVVQPMIEFSRSGDSDVHTAFLTGSFVAGSHSRRSPSLNAYFVSHSGRAPKVRLKLATLWEQMRAVLKKQGTDLLLDCHPYTIVCRSSDMLDRPKVTLTSKVFDITDRDARFNLPPTIGPGWASRFRILHGHADVVSELQWDLRRDTEMLATNREALSHYRNVLDHLPWALPWLTWPALLRDESIRYAEEALKDGVGIGLTADELEAGDMFPMLHDWRGRGEGFFLVRYGQKGAQAVRWLNAARERAEMSAACSVDEAREHWIKALEAWSLVWDRHCINAVTVMGEPPPWMLRVNSFV